MSYRPQLKTSGGMIDFPLDAETVKGKTILEQTYPVGSIYLSVNSTSPASLFGGTWEALNNGNQVYLVSSDIPVITEATKTNPSLFNSELIMGHISNNEWATRGSDQYLIAQSGSGKIFTSNMGSVPAPYEKAYPQNLWGKATNSAYSKGVYAWKRVA